MTKLRRTIRTVTTLAAAVLAVMALSVGTAFAQDASYPPDEPQSVDCVAAGQAGANVTCSVTGAEGGEVLDWTATAPDDTVIASGSVTADASGRASFQFVVPRDYRGQEITVEVLGNMGFAQEDQVAAAAPGRTGQPVPPQRPSQASLARTGQDAMMLAGVGVLLLGAGVVTLRRRYGQRADDRTTTSV